MSWLLIDRDFRLLTDLLDSVKDQDVPSCISQTFGEPTSPSLNQLRTRLQEVTSKPNFTFLDFGSGFGRVVMFMAVNGSPSTGIEANQIRHGQAETMRGRYYGYPARYIHGTTMPNEEFDVVYCYDYAFSNAQRLSLAERLSGTRTVFVTCARGARCPDGHKMTGSIKLSMRGPESHIMNIYSP